jgi:hypothetical protein
MVPLEGKLSLLLLVLIAVGVALLFKAGGRTVGIVLVALFVGAFVGWNLLAVRSVSRVERLGNINAYPDFDPASDGVLSSSEAMVAEVPLVPMDNQSDIANYEDPAIASPPGGVVVQQIDSGAPNPPTQPFTYSHQHEIVRNQRLAAAMPGAQVQVSPHGRRLETYPDGMQVEQDPSGERRLVRDADPGSFEYHYSRSIASSGGTYSSHSSHSSYGRIAFFATFSLLLLVMLLAFGIGAFIHRRRRRESGEEPPRGGWGAVLSTFGAIALLFTGMAIFGVRHETVIQGVESPVPNRFNGSLVDVAREQARAQQEAARERARAAQEAARLQARAQMKLGQELVDQVNGAMKSAAPAAVPLDLATMEQLWAHLTAPQILLTPGAAIDSATSPAQRELFDAAKTVLAATIPAADPLTQGWLVSAAKSLADSAAHPSAARGLAPAETQPATKVAPAYALKPKPPWLDNPPKFAGEVRRYVVSAGPYVTMAECEQALAREMREVVQTRFRDAVASASGLPPGQWSYNPDVGNIGMSDAVILREFCADEYVEKVDASVGEMLKAHALLEFGAHQDQLLVDYWKRWLRRGRVESAVILSSFAVLGLAFVFGLFKIDAWTRGYYTKRLFIGVPAFIIAVGGIALLWAMQ